MKSFTTAVFVTVVLLAGVSVFGAQVSIGVTIGPPPPPRVVYVAPAQPAPEFVWIDGYWYVVKNRYRWHEGYWTRPPYPGAYWVPPRHDGRAFFLGYWEGDRGRFEHDHHWDRDFHHERHLDDRDHDRQSRTTGDDRIHVHRSTCGLFHRISNARYGSRTCSDLAFHSPMRVRRGSCQLRNRCVACSVFHIPVADSVKTDNIIHPSILKDYDVLFVIITQMHGFAPTLVLYFSDCALKKNPIYAHNHTHTMKERFL